MSSGPPELWLHHVPNESGLRSVPDTDPEERVSDIYQAVMRKTKTADMRLTLYCEDLGLFQEGSQAVIGFRKEPSSGEIQSKKLLANIMVVQRGRMFGDLTDKEAIAMGFTSRDALRIAYIARYPWPLQKLMSDEDIDSLHVAHVHFQVIEELQQIIAPPLTVEPVHVTSTEDLAQEVLTKTQS